MNSLSHTLPTWWPWVAALWLVLAIVLGGVFIRRAHPHLSSRTRLLLWLLRAAASAVLLLLILNWSRETSRQTDEKPLIHILADRSASMAIKDAPDGSSRYQYAQHAIGTITGLTPQAVTASFTADVEAGLGKKPPDGDRSAIGQALFRTLDNSRQQALGGVVVLSDFAASDEHAIKEILQTYHTAKVPVFPWIIGTDKQPADIRLLSARLTQPSPSQPNLRLVAAVESPGFADQEVALAISYANQPLLTRNIRLTGDHQTVTLDFPSPFRGLQFYEIRLASLPGEALADNNVLQAACELRRDPIRVIYMEGSDPSETAFVKDALEADQDMEVHSLHLPPAGISNPLGRLPTQFQGFDKLRGNDMRIFSDARRRPVPSVCHPTRGFPTNMLGLLSYDVVILSDIIKEAFTPEQILNMVAFVEEFGGGFVMVGGDTSFGAGGWEKTPIDKLMPIEVANRSDPIWSPFGVKLMAKLANGPLHPVMQVTDTLEDTHDAWGRDFVGFNGINYVKRAKPGALVLARTSVNRRQNDSFPGEPAPVFGRQVMGVTASGTPVASLDDLVLFAVQQIGRGRAMAFCSDTTVAWGDQFEKSWGPNGRNNLYFAKFWNNIIRWLAADRIARKKGQTALQVSAPQCAPGDNLQITIPAASASELSFLEISVTEAGHALEFLPVIWNNAQRCWETRNTPRAPGEIRFEATYRNAEGSQVKLEAGVFATPAANESVAVAIRPALAAEIARETGGQVISDTNAAQVLEMIANKAVATTWKRSEPVWDTSWLLGLIFALIMVEWIIRRRLEPAVSGEVQP